MKGNSFSIDLRVANILHARWACEALFLALTSRSADPLARLGGGHQGLCVGQEDFNNGQLTSAASAHAEAARQLVATAMLQAPMPRAMPFERAHSDGMEGGASLSHLCVEGFCPLHPQFPLVHASEVRTPAVLRVNPLVALTVKERNDDTMVLHMRTVSSLTSSEYLRFSLICGAHLLPVARALEGQGGGETSELCRLCGTSSLLEAAKAAGRWQRTADGADEDPECLLSLLHYANIVVAPPGEPDGGGSNWRVAGKAGGGAGHKRQRT